MLVVRGDCRHRLSTPLRNLAQAGPTQVGNEGSTPKPGALVGRRRCPLTRRRKRQSWCPSQEGHDRERQRLVPDRPPAENTGGRERSSEGSRSRAHRSEWRWLQGKPRGIAGQAKARSSPSSEVLPEVTPLIVRKRGGWLWKPASKAKAKEEGDSGIERSRGCSYRYVGCRSWVEASFLAGQGAPQGERSLGRVA